MVIQDIDNLFYKLNDALFVALAQKITTDHPNTQLYSPIFLREYERRESNLSELHLSVLCYSLGKLNITSNALSQRVLDYLDKTGYSMNRNFALYALSNKLLDSGRLEKLKDALKKSLKNSDKPSLIKQVSKFIFQMQHQDMKDESLMQEYQAAIKRLGIENDHYYYRVFNEDDNSEFTKKIQPLTMVKQSTPYTQEKLYQYLKKGGFEVELEPVVGSQRMDLRVEDLCIEVDGMYHQAKTEADLHRDKLFTEICSKHGLRYLSIKANIDDEWNSDCLVQVINKLQV